MLSLEFGIKIPRLFPLPMPAWLLRVNTITVFTKSKSGSFQGLVTSA